MEKAKVERVLRSAGLLVLLLWIAGILFPFEWPMRLSPDYQDAFNSVFFAPWTHEPTHFALFFVLGILLSWLLMRHAVRRQGALFALVVVAVASAQEGLQLLTSNRLPGAAELLDLAVDLAGAATGAIVFWLWTQRHPEEKPAN